MDKSSISDKSTTSSIPIILFVILIIFAFAVAIYLYYDYNNKLLVFKPYEHELQDHQTHPMIKVKNS